LSRKPKDPNNAATVRVMASLTPRERRLLRARFGGDLDKTDLEGLKRRYEQTRARIEEIEERALRRLRRPVP
jgi:DNA-directed RNA polymerase sigma subunit (sigma70/sigma32)